MTTNILEIRALAARFLQHIATLPPDDDCVTASDLNVSYAEPTMQALDYLYANGYVSGRPNRSTGNTEGLVAILNVCILQKGRNWLAALNGRH